MQQRRRLSCFLTVLPLIVTIHANENSLRHAVSLLNNGQPQEALPILRAHYDKDPESLTVVANLGAALLYLEEYSEAIHLLRTATRLSASALEGGSETQVRQHFQVKKHLAIALSRSDSQHWGEAGKIWDDLFASGQFLDDPESLFFSGIVEAEIDVDVFKALDRLKKAAQSPVFKRNALIAFAKTSAESGDYRGAIAVANDVLTNANPEEEDPALASAMLTLSSSLLAVGEAHPAHSVAEQISGALPWSVDAVTVLARAQKAAGRPAAALKTLRQAVQMETEQTAHQSDEEVEWSASTLLAHWYWGEDYMGNSSHRHTVETSGNSHTGGWYSPPDDVNEACDLETVSSSEQAHVLMDHNLPFRYREKLGTSHPRGLSRDALLDKHGDMDVRFSNSSHVLALLSYPDTFGHVTSLRDFVANYMDVTDAPSDPPYVYMARPHGVARQLVKRTNDLIAHRRLSVPENRREVVWFLGPKNSGAPGHVHSTVIVALAHGLKRWTLNPPYTPLGRSSADARLTCLQHPGDLIYVPSHWRHAEHNLLPSIGTASEVGYDPHLAERLLSLHVSESNPSPS